MVTDLGLSIFKIYWLLEIQFLGMVTVFSHTNKPQKQGP